MNKIQTLKALNASNICTKTFQQTNVLNGTNKIKKQKTAKCICQVNLPEKEHYF